MTPQRLLVANRGEIAVRIFRACRDLGIETVAVYSDADRAARHVAMADYAVRLGPPPSSESYLSIPRILDAARRTNATLVHPGYGFLAESAEFARACAEAGLVFVGPSPSAIEAMGMKTASRRLMEEAGVPIVPGMTSPARDAPEIAEFARRAGYPVLLKASAGGGGKGMRRVDREEDLADSFVRAAAEAEAAFGDRAVYAEKLIENPRHVEVQVAADRHGRRVAVGERECSIQRRHQKVVEECPSPAVGEDLRARLFAAAVAAADAVGYDSCGTVEFLLAPDGTFYFLEMNTRLQVEHPITEEVWGVDLVVEMIRAAQGEPLSFGAGGPRSTRARDRMPRLRRRPGARFRAVARDRHPAAASERAGGAQRPRHRGGLGRPDRLRPDAREARGSGPRPRGGDRPARARSRRVRDRGRRDHARPLSRARAGRGLSRRAVPHAVARRVARRPRRRARGALGGGSDARGGLRHARRGADGAGARLSRIALEGGGAVGRRPRRGGAAGEPAVKVERRFSRRRGAERELLHVEVRDGGRVAITGPSGETAADCARLPDGRHSVIFPDGRQLAGRAVGGPGGRVEAWRGARRLAVDLADPLRDLAAAHKDDFGGPREVRALIPGRVVEVRVREGDDVAAGSTVLVLEAMKMQNEIRAESAARVTRVDCVAGQTVEAGALLLRLEPAAADPAS